MLVLTPTRELALQVTTNTDKYSVNLRRIKAVSILGGMPYPKQMQLLSRNPEILVATPGRLIDHMESGKIDFSQLQILVLDEADRMLDMGFIDDIEKIVAATRNRARPCCSRPRWTAWWAIWPAASPKTR
jgi:superfamily II DNA/RNA helicase